AVEYRCAEWMMSFSPNRKRPASSRASRIVPLPDCRGTTRPTSVAAHLDPRSPREISRTCCCHSSKCSPAASANCTASSPADVVNRGTEETLGVCDPILTALRELVKNAHLRLIRTVQPPDLLHQ